MNIKNIKTEKLVRSVLSLIVLIIMIRQIILQEWLMVILCLPTFFVFYIFSYYNKKYKDHIPPAIEISVYLFVFAAQVLGEVAEYYINISWWDDLMHIVAGMLLTSTALFFISLTFKTKKIYIKTIYKIVFAICISITTLTIWECIEFGADNLLLKDMQKDTVINNINSVNFNDKKANKSINIEIKALKVNEEDWIQKYGGYIDIGLYDTMYDLLDGIIGSVVYGIFSYFYINKSIKN